MTVVGSALLAVVVASCSALTRSGDGDAEGDVTLRQACGGLLPAAELARFAGDEAVTVVSEYGALTGQRGESVAFVDCSLVVGSVTISVHAEPVLGRVASPVRSSSAGDSQFTAPGLTAGGEDGVWLFAACPAGLDNRGVPARNLRVDVDVTSPEPEPPQDASGDYDLEPVREVERADATAAMRTAVHVANEIARVHRCGAEPLPVPTRVHDFLEDLAEPVYPRQERCDWLITGPEAPLPREGWHVEPDGSESEALKSWCFAERNFTTAAPESVEVSAFSVSGVLAQEEFFADVPVEGPYDVSEYERAAELPGLPDPGAVDPAPAPTNRPYADLPPGEDEPELALWAQSECVGGTAYHRVGVYSDRVDATADELHAWMSPLVHAVMDRYLAAPGAWPTAMAGCTDTRLLGEVWT